MRYYRLILLIVSFSLLSGCESPVRSLHPFYLDENLIQNSRIEGGWAGEAPSEVWEFSRTDKNGYKCVIRDSDGKSATLAVHLMEIQGRMFLDFFPEEPDSALSLYDAIHLLPVHTFASLNQMESTLELRFPSQEWLMKLLRKNPDALRHEALEGSDFVLTASTGELQRFWLAHLNTEGAFMEPIELRRMKAADH